MCLLRKKYIRTYFSNLFCLKIISLNFNYVFYIFVIKMLNKGKQYDYDINKNKDFCKKN